MGTSRSHFGIVRHRPPPFPSPHLARSDSRSLGLRCRSARPPGPPAPDHCQAGARAKRPVPAPCRVPVWGRVARPPAGPSAAHATPKSSLGAPPSWSCKEGACSSSRRSPLRLVAVALEEDAALATYPRGARSPRGAGRRRQARPLVPRGTLGGRPARRRVVEGARYGGPDPEGLHPATPCRRRPQGRDVCPHIVGARGARLCDKHDRTPKGPTLLLP